MGLYPDVIMTPVHTLGVRTASDYATRHRKVILDGRMSLPELNWREPWPSPDKVQALISGGRWIVACTTKGCSNAPLTHPDWKVARCFECGAIYQDVIFPENIAEISALLVKRAYVANRNWVPGETIEELRAENIANGYGV